jgi:hypothetical protein
VPEGKVYFIDLPKERILKSPLAKSIILDTLALDKSIMADKMEAKPKPEEE